MAHWLLLLLLLLTLVSSFQSLASARGLSLNDADTIHEACKHSPDPPFCIETLSRDPRSSREGYIGLAKISMEISLLSGVGVGMYVDSLVNATTTEPVIKRDLSRCVPMYTDIVNFLNEALRGFESKHYERVLVNYWDSTYLADRCEHYFEEEPKRESPIRKNKEGLVKHIDVSIAMVMLVK